MINRSDVVRIKMPFPDITSDLAVNFRIDCDKEFVTCNVCYDDRLKTITRPDVCGDVMVHVDAELICDGYISNRIPEKELLSLNSLISLI